MAAVEIMDKVEEDGVSRLKEVINEIDNVRDVHRIMCEIFERAQSALQDTDLNSEEREHHERLTLFAKDRMRETKELLERLDTEHNDIVLVHDLAEIDEKVRQTKETISAIEGRLDLYKAISEETTLTDEDRDLYNRVATNQRQSLAEHQDILFHLEEEKRLVTGNILDVD